MKFKHLNYLDYMKYSLNNQLNKLITTYNNNYMN